jgi:hypothetical protein
MARFGEVPPTSGSNSGHSRRFLISARPRSGCRQNRLSMAVSGMDRLCAHCLVSSFSDSPLTDLTRFSNADAGLRAQRLSRQ